MVNLHRNSVYSNVVRGMKTKVVEILIVMAILFAMAALFGCKDEAEGINWSKMDFVCAGYGTGDNPTGSRCERISSPNIKDNVGCFWYYCDEHYKQSDWIGYSKAERTVPIVCRDEAEPHEASEIEFQCSCGMQYKVMGYELCYSEQFIMVTDVSEPNNYIPPTLWPMTEDLAHESIEILVAIEEPNESEGPLDFIPTWPDYIELEKTLVLRYDYPEPNTPPHAISILPQYDTWVFNKGTKIYFKDD